MTMTDQRFEDPTPYSEEQILDIEHSLGRKLPDDYRGFVAQYGGSFVGGSIDASEDYPIDSFNEAEDYEDEAPSIPEWDEYKEIGSLPFASCALGNIWVLTAKNEVFFVNYYGETTTTHRVAGSFGEFISRIVVPDEDEDEK